jgi:2-iminobutanoate/2-iminopropanoate deaminase
MRLIAVSGAPSAAGPYSQGVVANGFLFTAGFTPRDPATSKPVQGDITVLANRVFDNLEAVLKGAGCSFKDVVKVTVYMTDLNDFCEDERGHGREIRRSQASANDDSGSTATKRRGARDRLYRPASLMRRGRINRSTAFRQIYGSVGSQCSDVDSPVHMIKTWATTILLFLFAMPTGQAAGQHESVSPG